MWVGHTMQTPREDHREVLDRAVSRHSANSAPAECGKLLGKRQVGAEHLCGPPKSCPIEAMGRPSTAAPSWLGCRKARERTNQTMVKYFRRHALWAIELEPAARSVSLMEAAVRTA